MKTRLSSTQPPAPPGFVNAAFAEVVEDGIRKVAVHVPSTSGGGWWARAILVGYQEPAEDVLVNRYRVILEENQYITLVKCGTTAKFGPFSGTNFAADVLRSNDDGATWESIFARSSPPDDTDLAYIADGEYKGDQEVFAIDTLFPNDLLSIDVITNVNAVGIEIVLRGSVSTSSPIDSPPVSPP